VQRESHCHASWNAAGRRPVTPRERWRASTYVVLYKGAAVPADAAETIAGAGGTLVSRFDAIGVAIARSTSSSFTDVIVKDKKVEGAAATAGFATQLTEKRGHAGDDPARAGGAEAAVTPDRAPYPAGA
jgi:hypothetical protein